MANLLEGSAAVRDRPRLASRPSRAEGATSRRGIKAITLASLGTAAQAAPQVVDAGAGTNGQKDPCTNLAGRRNIIELHETLEPGYAVWCYQIDYGHPFYGVHIETHGRTCEQ